MKKLLTIIFSLLLVVNLTACNNTKNTNSNVSTTPLNKDEFTQMCSDPDKFKGRTVDFYARVFAEPQKDDKGTYLQGWLNPKNSSNSIIIKIADPKADVKKDDIIHVKGTVEKKFEGQNAFGAKISAPAITASKIEKSDYATAFNPAIKTLTPDKEINQHGFIIKINKIELAAEETRVFLTVSNTGTEKFSFYKYNSSAVQGSKQSKLKSNFEEKYPDINTDILPGIKEEGVLIFDKLDPNTDNVKFIFEGSSHNYEIKINPFTFDIPLK